MKFQEIINHNKLALVAFCTTDCESFRIMNTVLNELETEIGGRTKILKANLPDSINPFLYETNHI